ncbi:MAG: hypothetical protein LC733_13610, partial [Actinobacteria bacterium]|nr:hypothetical protein [Actinomycetota bacterium]
SKGRVFRPAGSGGHGPNEIRFADRIAAEQDTDIVLSKEKNQAAVDGFNKATGQPLQLKTIRSSSPSRVEGYANDAYASAAKADWHDVELHLETPNMTKAMVSERLSSPNTIPGLKPMPGGHISRIQVYCSDGILEIKVPKG